MIAVQGMPGLYTRLSTTRFSSAPQRSNLSSHYTPKSSPFISLRGGLVHAKKPLSSYKAEEMSKAHWEAKSERLSVLDEMLVDKRVRKNWTRGGDTWVNSDKNSKDMDEIYEGER